jgi:hypothetical protein
MIEPILKWTGGERWLNSHHLDLFPKTYESTSSRFSAGLRSSSLWPLKTHIFSYSRAKRTPRGHSPEPRAPRTGFARKRSGSVSPLRCRHTGATRAVEAGIDLVTLAAMLGHSKIGMVLRYAHPTQEHQTNAMDKMEKYVSETEDCPYGAHSTVNVIRDSVGRRCWLQWNAATAFYKEGWSRKKFSLDRTPRRLLSRDPAHCP